jgi:gliotoxin/aspirochlorine biosynthesis thioredoxin reductase
MFSFGYEQRGSPSAGLLASGALAHPMHATSNVKDALKFVDHVTVYTDGNEEVHQTLSNSLIEGMNIDNRKIVKIRTNHGSSGVFLDLEDGQSQQVAFLVHKPDMILAPELVTDLGLETSPGMGIKVRPPFNETSVDGVFAAGDCCSMMRIIPNAWNMGASAGCGLAKQLPKSVWPKNGSQ